MYNHTLSVHGEAFGETVALPKNVTLDLPGIVPCGGTMGGLEVVVVADSDVTITATKAVTLKLQHSDDGTTWADVPVRLERTCPAGDNTFAPNAVLARLPVPSDCKQLVKATLGTTDTVAAGDVTVMLSLLPR